MPKSVWLNSSETAELLSISAVTVRRWTDNGVLQCVKTPGGHRRYNKEAIEGLAGNNYEKKEPVIDQPEPTIPSTSSVDFYARINMANTVLKLNLSVIEAISSIEEELGRVDEIIDTIPEVAEISKSLPTDQKKLLDQHIERVVTGLQYQDLFNQRLSSIKSSLDKINAAFGTSLSDFDDDKLNEFLNELKRNNARLDPNLLTRFLKNLVVDQQFPCSVVVPKNNPKEPEIF